MGLKPGARPGEALRPVLREVDWDRRVVVSDQPWQTAPDRVAGPAEHCELTAAWREGEVLLQPTRTEVLWWSIPERRVLRHLSHPLLYDVHSACPRPGGGVVVTCSGHESVLELSEEGELLAHHWLREGRFSEAYPGIEDFRRVPFDRFKPHTHHPNHAFWLQGVLWVTVLQTRECLALDGSGRRIPLPEGPPHDGRLREGLLWFTTVNGHVIGVDPVTLERRVHLDLAALDPSPGLLGWCRAVEVVGRRMWVGFTALRASRMREALRVLWRGEEGVKRPTRVVEVDLQTRRIIGEMDVGNAAGGTLYAIHALA